MYFITICILSQYVFYHNIPPENGDFYTGVNNQKRYNVEVRIRAWKKSSLPPADFERTGIRMKAGQTSNGKRLFFSS
jgi:hypothetical protein